MDDHLTPSYDRLVQALRQLPGIGPLSAGRIAFRLMAEEGHGQAKELAALLQEASGKIHRCPVCNTLCEGDLCRVCADASRESDKVCVVESPADQSVIERSLSYRGKYFVLGGRISPLEDQGPSQLGFHLLMKRIEDPAVRELILATSYTAQGDATAHYLAMAAAQRRPELRITRLARGVPFGVELEYTDVATVARAMSDRASAVREQGGHR